MNDAAHEDDTILSLHSKNARLVEHIAELSMRHTDLEEDIDQQMHEMISLARTLTRIRKAVNAYSPELIEEPVANGMHYDGMPLAKAVETVVDSLKMFDILYRSESSTDFNPWDID